MLLLHLPLMLVLPIKVVFNDEAREVPGLIRKIARQLILKAKIKKAHLPLLPVAHEVVNEVALSMQL